jgi:glycosyltransferase involved in cell wall biosynthesis
MTKLTVVAPVFNEESLINELVSRIKSNIEVITDDYEILIVDDGSEDQTWAKILNESDQDPRVIGIKFSRNFGHHYAITAGLHESKGDWVVVMDGDLQDRPEVIPDLFKKAKEGFEVVFVARQNRPERFYYMTLQKIFYSLLKILSGLDFDSRQANFSIISRKVVEAFKKFPENARFYGSTIKWLGFNSTFITANHGRRYSGKTSYTLKKRVNLALDIIFSFSERPLKITVYLGAMISTLAISGGLWILFQSFRFGYQVLGWPSLIISLMLFSGIIISILGVIGIYIGRVYREVKLRPLYVIESKTNIII